VTTRGLGYLVLGYLGGNVLVMHVRGVERGLQLDNVIRERACTRALYHVRGSMCARVCVRAACVRVCVCACVRARACMGAWSHVPMPVRACATFPVQHPSTTHACSRQPGQARALWVHASPTHHPLVGRARYAPSLFARSTSMRDAADA
jgi:hypothetical protein